MVYQHNTIGSFGLRDGAMVIDKLMFAGQIIVVAMLFTISPLALAEMDWQYFETGGNVFDKLHPATLLIFTLTALPIIGSHSPIQSTLSFIRRNADLAPFVTAICIVLVYAGVVLGHPFTVFLETFLGAVAAFIVFEGLPEHHGRTLARIIHVLMFANAMLAFYEVVSGFRLTPLVVNGEALTDEPRATALLGHPLANAIMTGAYVVALALGGWRDIPSLLKFPVFLVAIASLIPFGGRAATATCLLTLLLVAARKMVRAMHGVRFNKMALLWGLVTVPVCVVGVLAAFELGWLDTLLDRLVDDDGSAGTRIVMFDLFDRLTVSELVFGPDPSVLATWVRLYGLEYGIESFLIAFILQFGLLCTIIFLPCLFHFFYLLIQATNGSTRYAVFYFIIVALTSVSLSSKTPLLTMYVVLVLTLLRPRPQASSGP